MTKPTIFISHSSMDKDIVKILKDKLLEYTGATIDIFVSSDGESIPFGKNWLSTIENGLDSSSIMFLFVTSNSINNLWVSFEAGFGYSKQIKVIPICFGVSVSDLKYPLGLLQGYDIASAGSLNNIIDTINKEFDFSHKFSFTEEDFSSFKKAQGINNLDIEFSKVIKEISWKKDFQSTEIPTLEGSELSLYTKMEEGLLDNTKKFLDNKNIKFSTVEENGNDIQVSFAGVLLSFSRAEKDRRQIMFYHPHFTVRISSFNLSTSTNIVKDYFKEVLGVSEIHLLIEIQNPYTFRENSQDLSALTFSSDDFELVDGYQHTYKFKQYTLEFIEHYDYDYGYDFAVRKMAMSLNTKLEHFKVDDIYSLFGELSQLDILFLNESLLPNELLRKKQDLQNMNEQIKKWERETAQGIRI